MFYIRRNEIFEGFNKFANVVYHKTDASNLESFKKTRKFDINRARNSMYGKGVYAVYDLERNLRADHITWNNYYGGLILKCIVDINRFLIFDYDMSKDLYGENYRLIDQARNVFKIKDEYFLANVYNIGHFLEDAIENDPDIRDEHFIYSADYTRIFYKTLGDTIKKYVDGLIYTGRHDGRCCVSYNFNKVVVIGYAFFDSNTKSVKDLKWEKMDNKFEDFVDFFVEKYKEESLSTKKVSFNPKDKKFVYIDKISKERKEISVDDVLSLLKNNNIDSEFKQNITLDETHINGKYIIGLKDSNGDIVYGIIDKSGKIVLDIKYVLIDYVCNKNFCVGSIYEDFKDCYVVKRRGDMKFGVFDLAKEKFIYDVEYDDVNIHSVGDITVLYLRKGNSDVLSSPNKGWSIKSKDGYYLFENRQNKYDLNSFLFKYKSFRYNKYLFGIFSYEQGKFLIEPEYTYLKTIKVNGKIYYILYINDIYCTIADDKFNILMSEEYVKKNNINSLVFVYGNLSVFESDDKYGVIDFVKKEIKVEPKYDEYKLDRNAIVIFKSGEEEFKYFMEKGDFI